MTTQGALVAPNTEAARRPATVVATTPVSMAQQGRDGLSAQVTFTAADFARLATVPDDALAREAWAIALGKLGYTPEAITAVLIGETPPLLMGGTPMTVQALRAWIADPRPPTFALPAQARQQAYRCQLTLAAGDDLAAGRRAVAAFERDLQLDARLKDVHARYQRRMRDANNLLRESFLMLAEEKESKNAIDAAYAPDIGDEREAGAGRDVGTALQTLMETDIKLHPLLRHLSDDNKRRLIEFAVGMVNGTTQLGASAAGVADFAGDNMLDLAVRVLDKCGVDTRAARSAIDDMRQTRADMWAQATNIQTRELARKDKALAEKLRRGLPVGPGDLPSIPRALGAAVPQALAQAGIGMATGGMSVGEQLLVTGAINGGMAFGAARATSNDTAAATRAAVMAAAQTATFPLTSRLGIGTQQAADLATGYLLAKLQGQNEAEAEQSLIAQGLLGAGFSAHEQFTTLRRLVDDVVRVRYTQAATREVEPLLLTKTPLSPLANTYIASAPVAAHEELAALAADPAIGALSPQAQDWLFYIASRDDLYAAHALRRYLSNLAESTPDVTARTQEVLDAIDDHRWMPQTSIDIPYVYEAQPVAARVTAVSEGEAVFQDRSTGKARSYDIDIHGVPLTIVMPEPPPPNALSIEALTRALGQLPPSELARLTRVRVNPECRMNPKTGVIGEDHALGEATPGGDLELYPAEYALSEEDMYGVLIHESGHIVSFQMEAEGRFGWAEYRDAMANDTIVATRYAGKDQWEDFAEALSVYRQLKGTRYEAAARELMPNRFDFFDRMDAYYSDMNNVIAYRAKHAPPPENLRMARVREDFEDEAPRARKGKDRDKPGSLGESKGTDALRRENEQVDRVVKKLRLTPAQRQWLHHEISGRGYDYDEIFAIARDEFRRH